MKKNLFIIVGVIVSMILSVGLTIFVEHEAHKSDREYIEAIRNERDSLYLRVLRLEPMIVTGKQ